MTHAEEFRMVGAEAFAMLKQFYEYDRDIPLNARILAREEHEGYIREKIVFRGLRQSRVPGYLGIPAPAALPRPCILMAHGMGGSKEFWSQPGSSIAGLIPQLLAEGFAVFIQDAPSHGERTSGIDYESIWTYLRPSVYRELIVQWTVEHRIAMDYLAGRPEIDCSRIGILGYSLGGVMAYNLAGVDSRIQAAVIGGTAPLTRHYLKVIGWDEAALAPMMPIAPQTFAPAIKNIPFLMLNGRDDPYATLDGVQALYESIGSPARELALFESGHALPADHWPRVLDWFMRRLG